MYIVQSICSNEIIWELIENQFDVSFILCDFTIVDRFSKHTTICTRSIWLFWNLNSLRRSTVRQPLNLYLIFGAHISYYVQQLNEVVLEHFTWFPLCHLLFQHRMFSFQCSALWGIWSGRVKTFSMMFVHFIFDRKFHRILHCIRKKSSGSSSILEHRTDSR